MDADGPAEVFAPGPFGFQTDLMTGHNGCLLFQSQKWKRLKWVHMAHNNQQQRFIANLVLQLQFVFQCAVELVHYSQKSKYCQEQLNLWIYLIMS